MDAAVSIRAATRADAGALAPFARATYAAAFGASMAAADLAAHLERHLSGARVREYLRDDIVLVAVRSGALVGFAQLGVAHGAYSGIVRELRRLYVRTDLLGRGIGSRLLDAALAHPFFTEAHAIELDVWERNVAAQRLYARYGFVVVGSRPFTVASGAVAGADLVMVRARAAAR
jgi:diamine N-acetyltransferase